MAGVVAPPLCTWLVAACLSAACGDAAGKEKQLRRHGGAMFGSSRRGRPPGARCRGGRGARSGGIPMAIALHPERGAVESKKPDIKQRRVVVTGMGVVTPLGHDPDEFYNNLLQGVSGISEIEAFDCSKYPTRIAGEIKSFSTDGWVAPKLAKRMDKFMLYLITAGKKALENGGITEEVMNELDKSRCGVLVGSAMGGMKIFSDAIEALRVSYKKMNPFCVPFATTNMGSAILAMDLDRDGFVMGEGAGVLLLEELEHAKLRVNSTKSMTGHLLGAAGGIEAVAAIQAIRTGWVHPNINLDNPEKNVVY
uniref:beta-ketoacyl-[acyl-carrier-protein] synthase I n=1 Tax=Oryza nivara TaxID=4536 RepID=A0A0E0GNX1_ORYNI